MRFRRTQWIDIARDSVVYGIDIQFPGDGWRHCCEGKRLLFFENEKDRDDKVKEIRKKYPKIK